MRHAIFVERRGTVPGDLESAAEFRVEGHAERQTDVVLGLAAETRHEVVELEEAYGDYIRSFPVITTTESCGKGVV